MNDQTSKPVMNVAEIIKRVRQVDATIAELEAKFEETVEPLKKMSEAGRAVLLKYLNDTGQKGASTTEGGCNKRTKVSFQVRDREMFKEHVVKNEAWEMIAWRANDAVCEDYVQAQKKAPPGTFRNAVELLTVTAPPKPRLRKKKPGTLTEEEWAEIEREVDEEQDALESKNANGEAE
jgi:hypothetical protein